MSDNINNEEDTIPVEVPIDSSSKEDTITQEIPSPKDSIVEPYHEMGKNYVHKDRTINILNEYTPDKDIALTIKECGERLEKEEPTGKQIDEFSSLLEAFQEVIANNFPNNEYLKVFTRESSDWVQRINGEKGRTIGISNPVFALSKNSNELEGSNAIRFLSSAVGVGHVMRIPLWHSGIVLTLDAFKERKLLDLHQTLIRQKMDIGTNTKGASYSGDDIFVTKTIIEFILEHVIDTTLLDWDHRKLQKLILVNDIPGIIAGALASIYPRGYPLFHQCINTLRGSCNYSIEAKRNEILGDYLPDRLLDFRKVWFVDNSRLTITDKTFMSCIKPTHKVEEILDYQKRVNNLKDWEEGRKVYENDTIEVIVNFKISNLEDYFQSCTEWCTRVADMADKVMSLDNTIDEKTRSDVRNDTLNQYAITVKLLRQTNWIDYIRVVDSEKFVRKIIDPKTINSALEVFGQINEFDTAFHSAAQSFKEDSTFALTGLPNFKCPSCGDGQTAPNSKHPSIIPMNMISYFFILMVWRNRTRSGQMEI